MHLTPSNIQQCVDKKWVSDNLAFGSGTGMNQMQVCNDSQQGFKAHNFLVHFKGVFYHLLFSVSVRMFVHVQIWQDRFPVARKQS